MIMKYAWCTGCPLFSFPILPAAKPSGDEEIMMVAEAPTISDIRNRLLFSSLNTQCVRKVLRDLRIPSEKIYYTSVLKCCIPRAGKIDLMKAADCCSQALFAEQKSLKNLKLIIGFGNVALRAYTGKGTGILKQRGRMRMLDGTKILYMPSLTPAYISVNTYMQTVFNRDIELAYNAYAMQGNKIKNVYLVASADDRKFLTRIFSALLKQRVYSFDFETTGLDPYTMEILGIGFSWKEHTGVYIPWRHRKSLSVPAACSFCAGTGVKQSPKGRKLRCTKCKGIGTVLTGSDLIPYHSMATENFILNQFAKLFSHDHTVAGKQPTKIAHNIGFEYRWLREKWRIDMQASYDAVAENCFDTQLYAYARNPSVQRDKASISLESLIMTFPDLINSKDIWDGIPKPDTVLLPRDLSLHRTTKQIGRYCCSDCDGTLRKAREFLAEIETFRPAGFSFKRLYYDRLLPTAFFIADMTHHGISVRPERWKIIDAETAKIAGKALHKLSTTVYFPYGDARRVRPVRIKQDFNFNSSEQVKALCFGVLNCPRLKSTHKKPLERKSTDKGVLEHWRDRYGISFAADLLEYRDIAWGRKNLIPQLACLCNPVTGKVHASINIWGAETGRLSITNPPLMGMPSKGKYASTLRRLLTPTKGFVIIGGDYSQIELRLIAWRSQDPLLLKAYEDGLDVHTFTSAMLFSAAMDAVAEWQRRIGKTSNFALCYRGSWRVLLAKLGNHLAAGLPMYSGLSETDLMSRVIPESQLIACAQMYHKRYFATYKRIIPWANSVIERARQLGYVTSAYGRIRRLPDLYSRDKQLKNHAENAAVNFDPQSTASDYLLFRFQDIVHVAREAGIELYPLCTIHDALYLEVRERDAEKVADIVRTVGITKDEANITVPMLIEPKIGKDFSEVM